MFQFLAISIKIAHLLSNCHRFSLFYQFTHTFLTNVSLNFRNICSLIQSEVSKIANHLNEERVQEIVVNYGLDLAMYYDKLGRCKGHYDEDDCRADARDELDYETDLYWERLEELVMSNIFWIHTI